MRTPELGACEGQSEGANEDHNWNEDQRYNEGGAFEVQVARCTHLWVVGKLGVAVVRGLGNERYGGQGTYANARPLLLPLWELRYIQRKEQQRTQKEGTNRNSLDCICQVMHWVYCLYAALGIINSRITHAPFPSAESSFP